MAYPWGMPELPEVEITRLGLAPELEGRRITSVTLRRPDLRWPIPGEIPGLLPGELILAVRRRAKYLLLDLAPGSAVLHLGMSGSLRVLEGDVPPGRHDHVDIALDSGRVMRFNDPRRFGCLVWQPQGETHELLRHLGPEPLSPAFDGNYLYRLSRGRQTSVKAFLMDQTHVVGVGNIYAAESLFRAGIAPDRPASSVSRPRYGRLAEAVKEILAHAIRCGGTTFRDFIRPDGRPGYFEQELFVYGREGEPCLTCGRILSGSRQSNRATVWCSHCQT
jgi:formamidopyrimidine-DNA glycosylase